MPLHNDFICNRKTILFAQNWQNAPVKAKVSFTSNTVISPEFFLLESQDTKSDGKEAKKLRKKS